MKYSIVVPCYNEEGNIGKLIQEFDQVYDVLKEDGFELILVNNGSQDNTGHEIDECVNGHDYIKKVSVPVNQGYGYGIIQGMRAACGHYIGWIHADLQFSPLIFIDMAKECHGDHLYLKGLRKNRPFLDRFFTFGMSCVETVYLQTRLWDINAQPTLMDRELFDDAQNPPDGFSLDLFFYYSAVKNHYQIKRFPAVQKERENGSSSWNTGMGARVKLIKRTLKDSREMKRGLS